MKTFYVSLSQDLLHVYIEYQAESQNALHQYLAEKYLQKGVWKLPWCSIYEKLPAGERNQVVVKAQCGTIFGDVEGVG